jgi:hypothetical protein
MLERLIVTTAIILAAILIYRFYRPIIEALQRFDLKNRNRLEDEARDRRDSLAHFRHTLQRAEEQVEPVTEVEVSDPRTATPAIRFLFDGEEFTMRRDAERVRSDKVRALARKFYMELPAALTARRGDGQLR